MFSEKNDTSLYHVGYFVIQHSYMNSYFINLQILLFEPHSDFQFVYSNEPYLNLISKAFP
jgi:hypothetical protein